MGSGAAEEVCERDWRITVSMMMIMRRCEESEVVEVEVSIVGGLLWSWAGGTMS